jgi:hypothetical protein
LKICSRSERLIISWCNREEEEKEKYVTNVENNKGEIYDENGEIMNDVILLGRIIKKNNIVDITENTNNNTENTVNNIENIVNDEEKVVKKKRKEIIRKKIGK